MVALKCAYQIALFAATALSGAVDGFCSLALGRPRRPTVSTLETWSFNHGVIAAPKMSHEDAAEDSSINTDGNTPPSAGTENQLDPDVVELKQKVSMLESDIKRKKEELNDTKEMAERYTQGGYMRQVALVENNKRRRGANMADSKFAARATVIQSFLPVLDELDALHLKYEGNGYASALSSLRSGFRGSLEELSVTEYSVAVGEQIDLGRVVAVEEQYSEEITQGGVISLLKKGIEIQGNVVRPAECIVSLGAEKEANEAVEYSSDNTE